MSAPFHVPVLLDEVVELLALRPGARVIDATINGGGHAAAILERIGPAGRLLGFDRDPGVVERARERFAGEAGRLEVVHSSFRHLRAVAAEKGFVPADAILFDLGLSSYHFDLSQRGFSFARDEPLDLRFDPGDAETMSAAELLGSRSAEELARIFRDYGEERYASRIARAIAAAPEPIARTQQLYEIVRANIPGHERQHAGRSAARIFQALRIEANDELGAVREALPQALELLAPGGRLAVISFHSLEDRMVKQAFVAAQREGGLNVITKRPLRPSDDEVRANSRAASAKLRVAERRRAGEGKNAEIERVLRYWCGEDFTARGCEERSALWFRQSAATDNYIRERFGELVEQAAAGKLHRWAETLRGRLALIILLDQFPRNLFRGSPAAFAQDGEALRLALEVADDAELRSLEPLERSIFGLPLEHCEHLEMQERAVRFFAALEREVEAELRPIFGEFAAYAREHREVIARFGRFPYRNEALGRESTDEERAFLRG